MKAISFIKTNLLAILALATIVGFSSFKLWETSTQSTITLYFEGDTDSATEVADASYWVENSSPPTCSGDQKACSMTVNVNDVIGSTGNRELNPARIALNAISTPSGFIPEKNEAESHDESDDITVQNQD